MSIQKKEKDLKLYLTVSYFGLKLIISVKMQVLFRCFKELKLKIQTEYLTLDDIDDLQMYCDMTNITPDVYETLKQIRTELKDEGIRTIR